MNSGKSHASAEWETGRVDTHHAEKNFWGTAHSGNLPSLGRQLGLAPSSDSGQILLEGYQKWGGEGLVKRLDGIYAFVIWDRGTRTLFGARDPSGEALLYYHFDETSGRFVVADSLQSLTATPHVPTDLDERFVAAHLLQFYYHDELTWMRAVKKLPPGHFIHVMAGNCSVTPFWKAADAPRIRLKSDEEYAEGFLEVLGDAVRRRIPDSGGLGIHLSGGLDSTAVAGLCADSKPLAFSWQQPPPQPGDQTDLEFVEACAKRHDLEVHYCPASPEDMVAAMATDPVIVPFVGRSWEELPVQRKAAELGVTTIMSGFGGDEVASFAGGGVDCEYLLGGKWIELARLLRQENRSLSSLPGLIRRSVENQFVPDTWLRRMRSARGEIFPPHQAISRLFYKPKDLRVPISPYINEEFLHSVAPYPRLSPIRYSSVRRAQELLHARGHMRLMIEAWNHSGAAHNIAYVFPLMDPKVIEFALGMPPDQFYDGKTKRLAFRRAIQGFTPKEVCWAPAKLREPSRYKVLEESYCKALLLVRERILDRDIPPSRAKYLNMKRLLHDLEPEQIAKTERRAPKMMLALSFLDF